MHPCVDVLHSDNLSDGDATCHSDKCWQSLRTPSLAPQREGVCRIETLDTEWHAERASVSRSYVSALAKNAIPSLRGRTGAEPAHALRTWEPGIDRRRLEPHVEPTGVDKNRTARGQDDTAKVIPRTSGKTFHASHNIFTEMCIFCVPAAFECMPQASSC